MKEWRVGVVHWYGGVGWSVAVGCERENFLDVVDVTTKG